MLDRSKFLRIIGEKMKKISIENEKEKNLLDKIIEEYKNFDLKSIEFDNNFDLEHLLPLEYNKNYTLNFQIGKTKIFENEWAFERIKNYKVISIDTSEMYQTHISPYFILINLGYFANDYSKGLYYEDAIPYFFTKSEIEEMAESERIPSWFLNELRLKYELEVLENLSDRFNLENSFILFDESFSANYLYSASQIYKEKIISRIKYNLETLIKYGAYPIAVFYTRSKSFISIFSKKLNIDNLNLLDYQFFNCILKEGERSPLFLVRNKIIEGNLDLCMFYLKISQNNILRVEFPFEIKHLVNNIHEVIFLESIIGQGYPYCMQRAHEQAYLNSSDRSFILREFYNNLKDKVGINIFNITKKLERKILKII